MKNTLQHLIASRRAVFPNQFNDQPISKEEIKQLFDAANWAPTHRRTEPWRFKVLQGESKTKLGQFLGDLYKETTVKFSEMKYNKILLKMEQSAAVIAICMQRDPKESVPEWEEIAAVAMAVQNMWLMAQDLKIGGYWSSPASIKEMHHFFNFNEGEKCLGFFYIGKYDGALEVGIRKSSIEEKTEWLS